MCTRIVVVTQVEVVLERKGRSELKSRHAAIDQPSWLGGWSCCRDLPEERSCLPAYQRRLGQVQVLATRPARAITWPLVVKSLLTQKSPRTAAGRVW